jgi:hypothetical protein
MDQKDKTTHESQNSTAEGEVEFCLNCTDMDDLATSEEAKDLDQLHARFRNCRESGRFQGDLCARLFVAEDRIADPSFFVEDDESS